MSTARDQRGITTVEVLIAVAMVGVVVSAVIPAYLRHVARAADLEATTNLQRIARLVTSYHEAHGSLPTARCAGGVCWAAAQAPSAGPLQACTDDGPGRFPAAASAEFEDPRLGWPLLGFRPGAEFRYHYAMVCYAYRARGEDHGHVQIRASRYERCDPPALLEHWLLLRLTGGRILTRGPIKDRQR